MVSASTRADEPTALVQVVAAGTAAPIRAMTPEAADMAIWQAVSHIAGTYGGQSQLAKSILQECAELVRTQYAGLGVHELVEAFRMAVSGKIDVDASLYGGSFNAERLGKVLKAYHDWRRKVVAALEQEREAEEKAEAEARRNSPEARAAADAATLESIQAAREDQRYLNRWFDIPVFWYNVLERLGHICLTPAEKWDLYDAARTRWLEHAHQLEANANLSDRHACKQIREEINQVLADRQTELAAQTIAAAARKLAVHNHLYNQL